MPKYGRRSAEEEGNIQKAVTRLRSYSGFIDTPRLRRVIEQWVEAKRVEAAKDIDHVKDTYRKRAAVIGFRCGVIFHLLSAKEKETKSCLNFAVAMAEYCLREQIGAFGEALMVQYQGNATAEVKRYSVNSSVYDQLPPVFTKEDLRALKSDLCSDAALRKIVSRWQRDGWIEKVENGRWRKFAPEVEKE